MKAVFLDIDGVLISDWSRVQDPVTWFKDTMYPFDRNCVNRLNSFVEKNDAEIVLSSECRFRFDVKTIDELFDFNDIIKHPIRLPYNFLKEFRNDENLWILKKSKEIEMFVAENAISHFVILDDWDLICFPQHFIQTTPAVGLEPTVFKRMQQIMQAPFDKENYKFRFLPDTV